MLGPDVLDVEDSLNSVAGVYVAQGRYQDAEPLYKRSMAILEKGGLDHPSVAMPNIIVAPNDMRNVIAYILSLKD